MKVKFTSPELFYFADKQMGKINQGEYLKIVHNYIRYYYKRAESYKMWYLLLSVAKFLILAVIPVSQTFRHSADLPWLAAGASSLCIFLESVMALFRMKDKWILYRKAGNDLMCEERQYVMEIGEYSRRNGDKFTIFASNIEKIICGEACEWNRMVQTINTEAEISSTGEK